MSKKCFYKYPIYCSVVLYPDSFENIDLDGFLNHFGLPYFISPLHVDGHRKPHYHAVFAFDDPRKINLISFLEFSIVRSLDLFLVYCMRDEEGNFIGVGSFHLV